MDNKERYWLVKNANKVKGLLGLIGRKTATPAIDGTKQYVRGLGRDVKNIGLGARSVIKPKDGVDFKAGVDNLFKPTRQTSKYNPLKYTPTDTGKYLSSGLWNSPIGRASKFTGTGVIANEAHTMYDQLDERVADSLRGIPGLNSEYIEHMRRSVDKNKGSMLGQFLDPRAMFPGNDRYWQGVNAQNTALFNMGRDHLFADESPFEVNSNMLAGGALRGPVMPAVTVGTQKALNSIYGNTTEGLDRDSAYDYARNVPALANTIFDGAVSGAKAQVAPRAESLLLNGTFKSINEAPEMNQTDHPSAPTSPVAQTFREGTESYRQARNKSHNDLNEVMSPNSGWYTGN